MLGSFLQLYPAPHSLSKIGLIIQKEERFPGQNSKVCLLVQYYLNFYHLTSWFQSIISFSAIDKVSKMLRIGFGSAGMKSNRNNWCNVK